MSLGTEQPRIASIFKGTESFKLRNRFVSSGLFNIGIFKNENAAFGNDGQGQVEMPVNYDNRENKLFHHMKTKIFTFFFILISLLNITYGQQASLGDNIFREDFGQATVGSDGNSTLWGGVYFKTEPLPYINSLLFYNPSNPPSQYGFGQDNNWGPRYISTESFTIGSYSIATNSRGYNNPYFYGGSDHTGNDRGFMLVVDANVSTTLYFDREIEGLCAGTQFQFSVWIKDINSEGHIPPRVTFNIYNSDLYQNENSNAGLLASYTSTNQDVSPVNRWNEVTMDFTMPAGVDKIRLQIVNAVAQEIGNDLAIDDITFRPMGPPISFVADPPGAICLGSEVIYRARVLDGSAYPVNHFQLQRRQIVANGNNPLGSDYENVGTVQTTTGTDEAVFTLTPVTVDDDNYEYRVIVAGDPSTLTNKNCRVASEPITLRVYHHQPSVSFVDNENGEVCEGESTSLIANVTGGLEGDQDYFYLWEISTNQTDWSVVEGQSGATLNTGELTQTTYYRVTAYVNGQDGCPGQGASDILEVIVNERPTAPVVSNDAVICEGGDLSIGVDDYVSSGITYSLEKQAGSAWEAAAGFTFVDGVFTKEGAVAADAGQYRVVAQNASGCAAYSNNVAVTVDESCRVVSEKNVADANNDGLAQAEEELTYSITVTNNYLHDIVVTIEDEVPQHTTYVGNSTGGIYSEEDNEIVWNELTIPAGESITVSFVVEVVENLTGVSQIENTATVYSDEFETPQTPTVSIDTDPVSAFSSDKSTDKQQVIPGEELTYTITVVNIGDVDYDGITVVDQIPEHTQYVEGSASEGAIVDGGQLTWTINVPFGEHREVSFTVIVDEELTGVESIRNVATVIGEDPEEPEEPETETPVTPNLQFSSSKTVTDATGDGKAEAGEELTYTITVRNTGNDAYEGITIEDEIPEHTTYVAGSASHNGELVDGELVWTINLGVGEQVAVSFKVLVGDALEGVEAIRNVATVTGGDPDDPEIENPESPDVPVIIGPTANDDGVTTGQGESVVIDVLENDEPGNSPIVPGSVRLIDPATGNEVTTVVIEDEGTYTVGSDGSVTFAPDAGYVGNSTVGYTVKDENGLVSNEATITVTVEGVAAEIAPTAVDDNATTQYRQPVTITVLGNDQAGSSPIVPSTVRLIDEAGNRTSSVTISGQGQYEVNAQGIVTFVPAEGFLGTSTVRYEVSDENGLVSNTATITVVVNAHPFKIPNVFTPNGDGRNDVFEIVGIEGFDRIEIKVVNRWGNEVYRNDNYRNNWDGQGLSEGTYYYSIIAHVGGRQERYTGWVLIKRL